MDTQARQELDSLVEELRGLDDPRRATPQWKSVLNILRKTSLNQNRVANVVAKRSVEELVELVGQLAVDEGEEGDSPAAGQTPPPGLPPGVDEQTLASAMKAFRKRLKLTRLDDESKINSRNPLSKGAGSQIRSIQPPNDWPREVWDALATRGKLRYTGRGFYELTEEER